MFAPFLPLAVLCCLLHLMVPVQGSNLLTSSRYWLHQTKNKLDLLIQSFNKNQAYWSNNPSDIHFTNFNITDRVLTLRRSVQSYHIAQRKIRRQMISAKKQFEDQLDFIQNKTKKEIKQVKQEEHNRRAKLEEILTLRHENQLRLLRANHSKELAKLQDEYEQLAIKYDVLHEEVDDVNQALSTSIHVSSELQKDLTELQFQYDILQDSYTQLNQSYHQLLNNQSYQSIESMPGYEELIQEKQSLQQQLIDLSKQIQDMTQQKLQDDHEHDLKMITEKTALRTHFESQFELSKDMQRQEILDINENWLQEKNELASQFQVKEQALVEKNGLLAKQLDDLELLTESQAKALKDKELAYEQLSEVSVVVMNPLIKRSYWIV